MKCHSLRRGFSELPGSIYRVTGVLHVSDDTDRVFQVDGSGVETVFYDGSGVLFNPNAIAFDSNDDLYVLHGEVSILDSLGTPIDLSFATVGGQGLVVDEANGRLLVSDGAGLVAVDLTTGVVTTLIASLPFTEGGLALDSAGLVYFSAWDDGEVLQIDLSGPTITTFVDGLITPRGLRFDASGDLYITSYETNTIFRADSLGGTAPPIVNIQGSLTSDWVASHGGGFGDFVDITVVDDLSVEKFSAMGVATGDIAGTPQEGFPVGGFFHETGVDLVAGDTITVTDMVDAALTASVTLDDLEFTTLDPTTDLASGSAQPGADVQVEIGNPSGGSSLTVVADASGSRIANFGASGFDVTFDTGGGATVLDDSCDGTFVDGPQPPTIQASLTNNWVQGQSFAASTFVDVTVGRRLF